MSRCEGWVRGGTSSSAQLEAQADSVSRVEYEAVVSGSMRSPANDGSDRGEVADRWSVAEHLTGKSGTDHRLVMKMLTAAKCSVVVEQC